MASATAWRDDMGVPTNPLVGRRRFLRSAALIPVGFSLLGCTARATSVPCAQEPMNAVDVHCHIFNAADLPVKGFIQRVVFEDYEEQAVFSLPANQAALALPWFAAVLVKFVLHSAPTADEELEDLSAGIASVALPWRADNPVHVERLAKALSETLEGPPPVEAAPSLFIQAPDHDAGKRLFIQQLEREVAGANVTAFAGATWAESTAAALLSGSGPLARYFRWATWFSAPRADVCRQLIDLYGGADRVRLFTPALIDFSQWLDDEPISNLESQIKVMERIQREKLGSAVHCFVAFDPWRQVVDREERRSPTPLELVQWAIGEMGFVGVKLYPPMGFLPYANSEGRLKFPERARQYPNFPRKLDAALDELFAWAERESVPIMAHAADTNAAGPEYSARARPSNWYPVLTKYPGLRVNLAHFGGFDKADMADDFDVTWEREIGLLLAAKKQVYADLSYISEMLPDHSDQKRQAMLRRMLLQFVSRYDPEASHLLYGSDWLMLGRESHHQDYLSRFNGHLHAAGLTKEQCSRILSCNAVKFLGIGVGQKSRERIERYYRRHGLDDKWLVDLVDRHP